jgi:hypothetical protein
MHILAPYAGNEFLELTQARADFPFRRARRSGVQQDVRPLLAGVEPPMSGRLLSVQPLHPRLACPEAARRRDSRAVDAAVHRVLDLFLNAPVGTRCHTREQCVEQLR